MRSNRLRLIAPTVALAVLLAACGTGEASTAAGDGTASTAGRNVAPASFTADRLGGGELSSSSLDGKDTVLWFWAPWCTICRGEADDVVASARAFDGKVRVIGVAGRGEVPAMEGFVSDTRTGSLTHVVDADGAIWTSYGVFAQPAYAFIDDGGEVDVFVGGLGEKELTKRMNALAEA